MRLKNKRLAARFGAVLAAAVAGQATAITLSLPSGETVSGVDGFEWAAGNALSLAGTPTQFVDVPSIPGLQAAQITTDTFFQSRVIRLLGEADPITGERAIVTETDSGLPLGLNSNVEITLLLAATELGSVTQFVTPSGVPLSRNATFQIADGGVNEFFVFLDDAIASDPSAKSDPSTGMGFHDGHLVARGTLSENNTEFTIPNFSTRDPLDSFGPNSLPGTQTIVGSGSGNIAVGITGSNQEFAFFQEELLELVFPRDSYFTVTPFEASTDIGLNEGTNPSTAFVDTRQPDFRTNPVFITPSYGPLNTNGVVPPGAQGDFQFLTVVSNTFVTSGPSTVPLPPSVMLFCSGLGLMLLASRPRGRQTS